MNRIEGDDEQVKQHWQTLADHERGKMFVERLKAMLAIDPEVITALIANRVPCNEKMGETTAKRFIYDAKTKLGVLSSGLPAHTLGMLGVINGFLDHWRIVAHVDIYQKVHDFSLISLRDNDGGPTVKSEHGPDLRAALPGSEDAR